jgi:ABC-type branched-subunit amino acid transport system ATPase component
MRRPAVLMLDEPCSGLLRDEIDEIDAIVREVNAETGAAVVVVEHRLELLFALAGRVVVLDEGEAIAEGEPHDVFERPEVRAAYFETPRRAA